MTRQFRGFRGFRGTRRESGTYLIEAYCVRADNGCGTLRKQMLESDGVLDSAQSAYVYPKGYLWTGDDTGSAMDRAKRGLIRLELMRRKAAGEVMTGATGTSRTGRARRPAASLPRE
jgi:hypothetical protein